MLHAPALPRLSTWSLRKSVAGFCPGAWCWLKGLCMRCQANARCSGDTRTND